MPWIILIVAGLFEIGWAVGLKHTHGFTRLWPSLFTIAAIVCSMYLLAIATRTLPIGTAYAVWVGIGAAGAATLGMVALDEPVTPGRIFFLCLLVAAVIGLKITTPPPPPFQ
ncbi:MAG: quaternary ammonium compound efflux SMR transporter SugE [Phycisphaerales bacterium JB059]